MKIVTMDTELSIPFTATYYNKADAKEQFGLYDHPKSFYRLDQVKQDILLDWCESLQMIKSVNAYRSSYGLKHIFANDKDGFYVCNGQFKGAMILAGFTVEDITELNWHFNVSEKSIKERIKQNRRNKTAIKH